MTHLKHAGLALSLALGLGLSHSTARAEAVSTALVDGLSVTCSSTVEQLDGAHLSLRCGGTLSLSGHSASDTLLQRTGGILLEAAGDLSLSGLTLSAPTIELISHTGLITLSPDLRLQTPDGNTPLSGVSLQGEIRLANPSGLIVRTQDPLVAVTGSVLTLNPVDVQVHSPSVEVSSVPEPGTLTLTLLGAALALACAAARGPHARRH